MRKLLQYAENEEGEVMDGVTWAICLTIAEFLRTVFFSWNWALNIRYLDVYIPIFRDFHDGVII